MAVTIFLNGDLLREMRSRNRCPSESDAAKLDKISLLVLGSACHPLGLLDGTHTPPRISICRLSLKVTAGDRSPIGRPENGWTKGIVTEKSNWRFRARWRSIRKVPSNVEINKKNGAWAADAIVERNRWRETIWQKVKDCEAAKPLVQRVAVGVTENWPYLKVRCSLSCCRRW